MKKFVLGLLVGMSLMFAGSVFADDIQSFIGKTIQGQFPVTVDGKNLDMPAIVIDGNSFLPVRSFGQSVGYNVYFDPEGAIKLEKQVADSAASATTIQDFSDRQAEYDKMRAEREAKEKALQDQIKADQEAYDAAHKKALEEDAAAQAERKRIMEEDAAKQQAAAPTPAPVQ